MPFFSDMLYTEFLAKSLCARIAQLVEYELPKLGVAGSIPVSRSIHSVTKMNPVGVLQDPAN